MPASNLSAPLFVLARIRGARRQPQNDLALLGNHLDPGLVSMKLPTNYKPIRREVPPLARGY